MILGFEDVCPFLFFGKRCMSFLEEGLKTDFLE